MSSPALRLSIEVMGEDKIMFAADYPYESVKDGVKFMDEVEVTEVQRRKIYADNATRIFGLG
jgi:2,3-dihydroxybenzoate decarboxylase